MSTAPDLAHLTQWLAEQPADEGSNTGDQLFVLLYQQLRQQARAQLRKEDAGHTLSPTALVHEAWFRMAEQTRTQWKNRAHYLATAALMMRRILVNHALARQAAKRDAGERLWLDTAGFQDLGQPSDRDVVAVHEALLALEAVDPRAAQVVTLRYFGGLENEEVAEALSLSLATVKRDWSFARAWLHKALG